MLTRKGKLGVTAVLVLHLINAGGGGVYVKFVFPLCLRRPRSIRRPPSESVNAPLVFDNHKRST